MLGLSTVHREAGLELRDVHAYVQDDAPGSLRIDGMVANLGKVPLKVPGLLARFSSAEGASRTIGLASGIENVEAGGVARFSASASSADVSGDVLSLSFAQENGGPAEGREKE